MTYSLRTACLTLVVLAGVFAVIAAFLKPPLIYEVVSPRDYAGCEYAEANSSRVFRGAAIPTLVFGDARCKSVPNVRNDCLPFAVVVLGDEFEESQIDSTVSINSKSDVTLTTLVVHDGRNIEFQYELVNNEVNDNETIYSERCVVNGQPYDLTSGRLFRFDLNQPAISVRQFGLKSVDRSVLPPHDSSNNASLREVLDWWNLTKVQFVGIAG